MAGFRGQRSNVRKLGEHRAFPVDVDEDRRRAENLRIADARTMVFLRSAQKFSSRGLRNLRKSITASAGFAVFAKYGVLKRPAGK